MKSDRLNYVLVGAFVIAMLAGVVLAVAALSGRTGPTERYFTQYQDVTGLKFGSKVLYMGFPVGQVTKVELADTGDFTVTLALTRAFKDWRVPADSVAEVKTAGLLAGVAVDIRKGESAELLKPGDTLPGRVQVDVFAAVGDTANTVKRLAENTVEPMLMSFERSARALETILQDDGKQLVANLQVFTAELARRGPEIVDRFVSLSAALEETSGTLAKVLSAGNAAKVNSVLDNVVSLSEEILALGQETRTEVSLILNPTLRENIHGVASNLGQASADVSRLTQNAFGAKNVDRIDAIIKNTHAATDGLSKLLRPANVENVDETLDDLRAAASAFRAAAADLKSRIASLAGNRGVQGTLSNISIAAEAVADLSRDLQGKIDLVLNDDMAKRVYRALVDFAGAARSVDTLSGQLLNTRKLVDGVLIKVDALVEESRPELRASLKDLRHGLGSVSQHIGVIAYNLEGASHNMLEFSRQIRNDPSVLLLGREPQEDLKSAGGG